MKLNNHGWGMRQMIWLTSGLLIALIVAIYFISVLFNSLDIKGVNNSYFDLETKLENAAIRYVSDNDIDINNIKKISLSTLKNEGYIEDFRDEEGNYCGGYVKASYVGNVLDYEAYISCNNYETEGY